MPERAPADEASASGRRMRADARENRIRILDAARQLLVEHGPDVPLDQIAARAGVSIATFYRRFDDRIALLRAIVIEESEATMGDVDAIIRAIEAGADREAWTTAIHDLVVEVQSRFAPVFAAMTSGLLPFDDEDLACSRTSFDERFQRLVEVAQVRGLLRTETDHEEFGILLLHATQPIPHLTAEDNRALASRVIHILLAGLHPDAAGLPLPGTPFHPPDGPPAATGD